MKKSKGLLSSKHTQMSSSSEESSFKLVSTLLTEVLERSCQRISIAAESGNFMHDHAAEVECIENTHFRIKTASVTEKEQVTDIVIDGSVETSNKARKKFSIFFTMKRQFMFIPKPYKKIDNTPQTRESTGVFNITGMLYNSIFTLSLSCVDNAGCQYPLGTGRGYLIFDEEQLE